MPEDRKLDYDRSRFNPTMTVEAPEGMDEAADKRLHPPYVYTEEIILAINIALATGRPLLIRGPSGVGKSSLAHNVADVLERRMYESVITSRTQANDLLWEIDLLKRLNAAHAQGEKFDERFEPYVLPGPLWWAFDNKSATWRGSPENSERITSLTDPSEHPERKAAVVLLDEIDKADPDVPNNLLVPLGSLRFQVRETGVRVETTRDKAPLVFITTNEERELPVPFLRRCVELKLEHPSWERMIDIGVAHFKGKRAFVENLLRALVGEEPSEEDKKAKPLTFSPAEFLDTVEAALDLEINEATKPTEWKALTGMTVFKHGRKRPSP